jgi:adenylate kinase family enzyme
MLNTSIHDASKLSRARFDRTMVTMGEHPRRIAVVGRAGSGKTTIARQLAEALSLPVIHLDALYWTPDWMEVDRDVFEARQRAVVDGEEWIIDGGYLSSRGWSERLRRAELVVVTEAPLLVCLWRVVRRSLYRSRRGPDRPRGGHEQLSLYFLWWIVTWGRRHPRLAASIATTGDGKPVVVVRRPADLEQIGRGTRSNMS